MTTTKPQPKWTTAIATHVRTGGKARVTIPANSDSDLTILGVTSSGYFVARLKMGKSKPMVFGLTECCGASAKGSMGTVVCRSCYEEIDPAVDILDERDIEFRVND